MPFEQVKKWNAGNNFRGQARPRAAGCALSHSPTAAIPNLRIGENVQQALGMFPPARVTLLRGTGADAGCFAILPDEAGEWKFFNSSSAQSKTGAISCGMIFANAPKFASRPVQWTVRNGALIIRVPDDLQKYMRRTEASTTQPASPLNGLRASAVA